MKSILFLFLLFLSMACFRKAEQIDWKPYTGPALEVNDVETLYSDSAVLRVKLRAPVQIEHQNGNRDFPEGLFMEFYDEKGIKSSTLSSNKGKFDKELNMYKVMGNVVVRNTEEEKKLSTEELFWDPDKGKVYTPRFVRIETPEEILTGEGLDANQDFTNYKIRKPAGIFSVKEYPGK